MPVILATTIVHLFILSLYIIYNDHIKLYAAFKYHCANFAELESLLRVHGKFPKKQTSKTPLKRTFGEKCERNGIASGTTKISFIAPH